MKKFAILLLFLIFCGSGFAQTGHKVVFQLTASDTLAHKALMRQLGNMLTVAPDIKIEVVCHGPGLEMLLAAKSVVSDKIAGFAKRGEEFMACEFSMKERKVDKTQIIPSAGFVEAGIIEIITKQEKGWSYIKSGF